jgi:DNA-directed RNA polymerase subunit F
VLIKGDANVIGKNISITGDIGVNKEKYINLNSEFKTSLDTFLLILNKKSAQLSEEQKKSIEEILDKLTKEAQGVNTDEAIKDEDKKDNIKSELIDLAEKIVDVMPDIAESIASVSPLTPFSKAIGKGASYFSELIKKKMLNR